MVNIGNADRVALMQRLVLDPKRDELQVTRLKRRKLLLKDQIAWIERQIDPDVPA